MEITNLAIVVLIGLYGVGMWKFLAGFSNTNYDGNRIALAVLWPALFLISKSYRENFQKALKG